MEESKSGEYEGTTSILLPFECYDKFAYRLGFNDEVAQPDPEE